MKIITQTNTDLNSNSKLVARILKKISGKLTFKNMQCLQNQKLSGDFGF